MSQAVEKIEGPTSRLPVQSETSAVLHMIERVARDASVDMDKMTTLMKWHKDTVADQKRAAFDEAMAEAKAAIPTIRKNREVDAGERNGKQGPKYRFEDLAEIARTIDPILGEHGLSYRFKVSSEINQPVRVTCIVSHRAGHFEETTLTSGKDDGPGRNAIQQIGSTITYLQRYTLKAALGLAASQDDDGRTSEQAAESEVYTPPPGSITQEQADNIRDALEAKGASSKAFLQWAKRDRIEGIPAEHYDACIAAINKFNKV